MQARRRNHNPQICTISTTHNFQTRKKEKVSTNANTRTRTRAGNFQYPVEHLFGLPCTQIIVFSLLLYIKQMPHFFSLNLIAHSSIHDHLST